MGLTVNIKTVSGETAKVQALYTDTVEHLKNKVEKSTSLGKIRDFVRKGVILDDFKTLAQCGFENNELIIATIEKSAPPKFVAVEIEDIETSSKQERKLEKPKKCATCGKGINLVEQNMPCRCSLVFCEHHRPPEKHHCPVNISLLKREQLARDLMPSESKGSRSTSSSAKGILIYNEFAASHRSKACRQMHAVALGFLAGGCLSALGAEWDGQGVPTWIKRLVLGYSLAYLIGQWSHSKRINNASGDDHDFTYCLWSRQVWQQPWGCLKAEFRNLVRVLVDLVTHDRRNCVTRHALKYKKFYDPS
ncbi:hypothetical protein GUITHDRAFT_106445 [Guillardia theta CCMP2712]|uniref:Ubiquitin-like domain-containing protein n=1 Tax=Guillardia theta (strain CCMP2712) TaxID=905079 RepID=L1JIC7_GUITC|nr:hypothetical protein GUITHDRAFT_106445 [Guillardia theta CCMP2712]EKX47899.1 hypothetical protein GUITHDRAFT_106445 [Guillardia theta CCMP2712]|eukprot:XP_005834879.1 hypothetical protein GUITHDRAFT_106445 [Guillardia theta CCMP2712]